ncbi:MAG: hypothetical protein IKU27_05885, partial [Clostridia bacterium]|nr:hypothetical protein [Clostridia bacterium]
MEIIKAIPGGRINIGRRGEHLARQVQFDLTEWIERYGEGQAELLYQRPGDQLPYPIAARRQGNLLLWDVDHTDTARAGRNGRAEIRYYVDEVLVILEISYVQVEQTLENPDKVPDPPGASWFDRVLEQVRRVEAPMTEPPIINGETGTWMIYDRETEQYENTGYPATGRDGADGMDGLNGRDGKDGRDGIDGKDGTSVTHRWEGTKLIITSAGGTSSADLKGEKGDPGNGAQADFAENDPAKDSYIKNRTHWKEVVGEDAEIIPQTTVTFAVANGISTVSGMTNGLTEGVRYLITLSNLELEGRCRKQDDILYIGDGSLFFDTFEHTGEGFCILGNSDGRYSIRLRNTQAGASCTLRMRSVQEVTWHKLDRNYLPDGLGGDPMFIAHFYVDTEAESEILETDATLADVEQAFAEGKVVSALVQDVYVLPLTALAPGTEAVFSGIITSDDGEVAENVVIHLKNSGEWTLNLAVLPSTDYADNNYVRTFAYQSLSDSQKAQARSNIGALAYSDVEAVLQRAKDSGKFDGSDANVTAENITAALGYTPANAAKVSEGNGAVPDYWKNELETKASAIQTAMEQAGRNKSAFLWYTDAHWPNGNSKVSPRLLHYLYEHTPMNKVNFGGDIIGDDLLSTRKAMEYLYDWRKAIKGLPNHHSVFGNHDNLNKDSVDYEDENYRYAFLLAPEESADMIMGDGNYYYIDNPAEKTRYLYLDYITGNHPAMMAQGMFFVNAIKSTPEGWHIVAIGHRWWQYSSSSTPTAGSVPAFEADLLSIFDAYNARQTRSASNYFAAQDFTEAKGKVE